MALTPRTNWALARALSVRSLARLVVTPLQNNYDGASSVFSNKDALAAMYCQDLDMIHDHKSEASEFETPSLELQVSTARAAFSHRFGAPPQWTVAAPGRVNLIGEHTDYNEGFVFPLAIERYVVMTASPSDSTHSAVFSTLLEECARFAMEDFEPQRKDWTSYVRGVFAGCQRRGIESGPLNILVDSNVPLGSGLSSSAALEVAAATLIEAVTGVSMDPVEKARICQRAEHEFPGVPCGIMDMFSSALGAADRLLLIDCRSETAEQVPLDDAEIAVLVINSNVKHELTGGEYAERRDQCERAAQLLGVPALRDVTPEQLESLEVKLDDLLYCRARHVVTENDRTLRASEALRNGDWPQVGELMYASHASLREDYQVSCPELDLLVELAQEIGSDGGVIGSRMTGGGFGGCTVSLVRSGREREIA
ncbi:MAG: galactokinase, partial [Planctomycetota bacterium]